MRLRYLFLFIFTFLLFTQNQAQTLQPCGTVYPPEMDNWLRSYKQQYPGTQRSATFNTVNIPLKVHLVGTSNGSGHFDIETLYDVLCELNQQFEPVGFHFYLYGNINYINNDSYYNHSFSDGNQMMQTYNVNGVVNMYIVNDPAGNCGYFSPSGNAIAVAKSCADRGNTTIAHELGHYFSLPHTFNGWEGGDQPLFPERADGSNCAFTGDYFCDTPADYLYYRWQCPYTGNLTDPAGMPIHPDETLYMSYAYDACTNRFSGEQIDAMRSYLQTERTDLLNHPPVSIKDSVGSTTLVYPLPGATNIPANYVYFKWRKAYNAEAYHLTVRQVGSSSVLVVDEIVTDTVYLVQLQPNKNHLWKVKPLALGNTCAPMSNQQFFKTGPVTGLNPSVTVTGISCHGAQDAAVNIAVGGGISPYSFKWSNGATSASLVNLAPGAYYVTITDQSGDSIVIPIDIVNPPALELSIQSNNNQTLFTAIPHGGTPPYQYYWSDGSTNATLAPSASGSYSVTVVDNHGCMKSDTIEVVISSINSISEGNMHLNIFPAPVTPGQLLHIEVDLNKPSSLTMVILNIQGEKMLVEKMKHPGGHFQTTLTTDDFLPGIYVLMLQTPDTEVIRKFTVLR